MSHARRVEKMIDAGRVVAQHAAVADAETATLVDDDAARLERLGGELHRLPSAADGEVGAARRERLEHPVDPRLELAPGDRRTHRRGEQRRRQHFVQLAYAQPNQLGQREHVRLRLRIDARHGNRRSERDEHARPIADGITHHLGQLACERPLLLLHALARQDVIFEHQIVRDADWKNDDVRVLGGQRRVNESGLGLLQLSAVAPSAFRIEKQIMLLQDLGDVRLERDQIRRIFRVAADRNRAGDVLVNQTERPAEQVDARGDQRRPDSRIVEHDGLDEVIDVTPVIGGVHDAVLARRVERVVRVLGDLLDFSEDRIERMLERTVHVVPLRRPQLFEIAVDLLAARGLAQVLHDLLAREDCLRNFVEHKVEPRL